MTSNLKTTSQTSRTQLFSASQERRQLIKAFWLAVSILLLIEIYTIKDIPTTNIICATSIAFAAIFPLYLWCSGKALGMPIFPVFALTYLWTYALPLLSSHSEIIVHNSDNIYFASVTVTVFLGLGTFIWLQFVKSSPSISNYCRVLKSQNSEGLFLITLAVAVLFNMNSLGGWFVLEGGTFALVRGTILSLNVLAVFVLAYRSGNRSLSRNKFNTFLILLSIYILTNAASLSLVGALSITLLAVIAFIVGRRQVPWFPVALVLMYLLLLHYGKGEMRDKYWGGYQTHFVQPWDYPAWYVEWTGYSLSYFNTTDPYQLEKQSLIERASLMHLLLRAQVLTPERIPYLSGATYVIIPNLLVPRVFNKNKIYSHEGTYLLNIHYRLQTREYALKTTIGWGLLNEAYANFGFFGCTGLAVMLGAGYGQATRWSMHTPLLSSRSLFSVLLISFAFQSEFTAGVYIAALFQSLVPWGVISFLFMNVHSNKDAALINPN